MNLIAILFWVLALVNLAPAISAVMPSKLESLYGVGLDDQTMLVLLQHRALLLGLVGGACAFAAHMPSVRWPALIMAIISMTSFIVIAAGHKAIGGPLAKIALVDALALPAAVALLFLMMKP